MKNLKKVLALALAFVMCFTMFAGAAVYTDVPAGSDYSEAVTLLSDLGVIAGKPDGSYGVNDTITRADAACLIARMMTGETTPSKYAGASNFTDVAKDAYYESSVAYCAIMGITSGTGNGAYSPLRTITDGEFIAMVTRALGYDTAANPLQFPMGNIAVAQQEGLLDGVNCVASSPALRGEDAQIIYNALFADYDRAAKANNIYEGADEHREFTIAEEVFDLARLAVAKDDDIDEADFFDKNERDNMTCESHKWVVVGKDNTEADTYVAYKIMDKDDKITDEALTFEYTGDAESIYGYEVELWGKTSHTGDDLEVVAVKTVKGQSAYDYAPTMADDDDDDGTIELDDVELDVNDDNDDCKYAYLKLEDEDKFFSHTDEDEEIVFALGDVEEEQLNQKSGFTYKLIDWDSDGDVDFVVQTERYYGKVNDIDDDSVSIESLIDEDEDFDIDEDDYKVVGADKVEEDDIVEITVTRSHDKKEGEVVTIHIEEVETETKEYDSYTVRAQEYYFDGEDDPMYWAIDDADWHAVDPAFGDDFEKGEKYTLYLNHNGYIVASDEGGDSENGYLMILDTKDGEKWKVSSKDKLAEIEALLSTGKVEKLEVAGSMKIDGETDQGYDKGDYSWDESKVVGKVFKYYTDKDGVVTKLTSVVGDLGDPADVDGLNGTAYYFRDKNRRLTVNGTDYTLKSDAVVFLTKDNYIDVDDDDLEVDEKNVMAVKASELPDIDHPIDGGNTSAEALMADVTGTYLAGADYTVAEDASIVALTGEFGSSRNDMKVALLGVDSFKDIKTNVSVALITDVRVGSKYSTVYGALDGKVAKTFKTVEDDEDKIFFDMDGNGLDQDDLDEMYDDHSESIGYYAEVYTNDDGEITQVTYMDESTVDFSGTEVTVYEGDFYTVHRAAITDKDSDEISVLQNMTYAGKLDGEQRVATDKAVNDTNYETFDLADDVDYYTISKLPGLPKSGQTVSVTNGFKSDENLYSSLKAASLSDVKVSDDKVTNKADFYFADIALNSDHEIVALFDFNKKSLKGWDGDYVDEVQKEEDDAAAAAAAKQEALEAAQTAQTALNDAKDDLEEAKPVLEAANETLNEKKTATANAKTAYQTAVLNGESDETVANAKKALEAAETQQAVAQEIVDEAQAAVDAAQTAVNEAQADYDAKLAEYVALGGEEADLQ